MSELLANLVIPTHNRQTALRSTLSSLQNFYGKDAELFNVIIVDSSAEAAKIEGATTSAWGRVIHLSVPGMHVFRKMQAAHSALDNALPVIYATDDDLFGYSVPDIVSFAQSRCHYSACRHLLFRSEPVGDGRSILHFWKGWDHFEQASRLRSPVERLQLFNGQGMACFNGLFSHEAFSVRAKATSAAMDELGDGAHSSLVEDLANLGAMSLSWHAATSSWCFRFLDRGYKPGGKWEPSWVALDNMRRQQPDQLARVSSLLAGWLSSNLRISGESDTSALAAAQALNLMASHAAGYQSAHSRKWRGGKDFIYAPWEKGQGITFLLLPNDRDRPIFKIFRPVTLTDVDKALFEDEWLTCPQARALFEAMSDDFLKLR